MNDSLLELERALTSAVQSAAPSVVGVAGRRRHASGFAIRESDLVLTASHVVRHGSVRVTTHDGSTHDAELLGRHGATDIALLRVPGADLTPAAFRATPTPTGTLALALGRPGHAVRASLRMVGVTATDVDTSVGRFDTYIETDRALPYGFAGGPLLDLDGRVIGMNTDALLRGADIVLPRTALDPIVDAILKDGGVKRGYLGVGTHAVDLPEDARERAGQDRGAMVVAVQSGSAAAGAGLMIGDVLLEVAGARVTGPRSLGAALADKASAHVEVTLLRAGAHTTVSLVAGERPG